MKKFSFRPVIFMIIVTVIYTGVLATINEVTKDRVLSNKEVKKQSALLYVLDIPTKGKNPSEINKLFNSHFKVVESENDIYYEGYKDNSLVANIYPVQGNALWGSLEGLIGLTPDLNKIVGIEFLSHNETPGLGGRIDEDWFKEQFREVLISKEVSRDYINYKPNMGGTVDSISGATVTSNSVLNIINENIEKVILGKRGDK
ncbi:FMN-binding protein [Alkaliphilus sp. MSJ-5]|uniref:Ion-translocating oxidoreductase complex subunit G n=1 Tax=Alkaliphilus flagellatus TaxID=2841507 RepID=A0ABS6FZA6_9FIRM|nr:FMN-binding protein [Alkaliphilus flagellatus]MBU5675582.1 FMN-binding protein [Alkaliphilus flagellatus]